MGALTQARNTPQKAGEVFDFPVKGSTTIHQGALVVLAAGLAAGGSTAAGLIAVGRAELTVAAVADGDAQVPVRRGIFKYANSAAGDLITQADVGADCWIVDDQTVAKTHGGNTRSRAGKVVGVAADGVWIQIGLGL